jgi:hypothetical protein
MCAAFPPEAIKTIYRMQVNAINNPFPVDVFPLPIQEIITATHQSLNYPVDFIGASLLFASATATGNTCRIEVKPGCKELLNLYPIYADSRKFFKTTRHKYCGNGINRRIWSCLI